MSNNKSLKPLRFGIPSLDELIGAQVKPKAGSNQSELETTSETTNTQAWLEKINTYGLAVGTGATSLCLMGPDGGGKSILAMHLASRYKADSVLWYQNFIAENCYSLDPLAEPYRPQVLYVSTDLLYGKAHDIWTGFLLNEPPNREIPFFYKRDWYKTENSKDANATDCQLTLQEVLPPDYNTADESKVRTPTIDEFLEDATNKEAEKDHNRDQSIGFLDLAAHTAGDDWSYINRILSVLPKPDKYHAKHLMIIDAIEGLEVLAGEHDAYGERRTRRSRIAQLVRTAAEKCHLVFVVEEMKDGERLAEEFVADLVIRLRAHGGVTVRRTLEIIKARGQAHKSDEHDYVVRNGVATLTGRHPNPDAPTWNHSYVHVMQGVNSLFQNITVQKTEIGLNSQNAPTFGIRYLDPLFGYNVESFRTEAKKEKPPQSDYPTITAIIGDVATYKTSLAQAFLSECFSTRNHYRWPGHINPESTKIMRLPHLTVPHENTFFRRPVAVLLTTQLTDATMLARSILKSLRKSDCERLRTEADKNGLSAEDWISRRIVCRRFPVRDLSAAEFFHVIESAVWEARRKIGKAPQQDDDRWRGEDWFSAIRLVIDDWQLIKSLYPAVAKDAQILPFLTQYLQWQQVMSLIVDTQPGDPETIRRSENGRDLRNLTHRHIYTWHVPFYKEDRVAVAVIPPLPEATGNNAGGIATSVRELRIVPGGGKLEVDPHFERYFGLERGDPHPLPLQVMLYSGSSGAEDYLEQTDALLRQFFTGPNGGAIIGRDDAHNYEALRQLAYTPRGTRLDTTLLLQVDEFWQHSEDQNLELSQAASDGARFCINYLNAITVDDDGKGTIEDPFLVYQPAMSTKEHDLAEFEAKHKQQDLKQARFLSGQNRRRHSFFPLRSLFYTDMPLEKELRPDKNGNLPQSREELREKYKEATTFGDPEELTDLHMVPMIWDFGFLLCRRRSWLIAGDRAIPEQKIMTEDGPRQKCVLDLWKQLVPEKALSSSLASPIVTWFEFFQASKIVAEMQHRHGHQPPIFAFDIDQYGPSTLSCLMLEIWASEYASLVNNAEDAVNKFFPPNRVDDQLRSKGHNEDKSLIDLLQSQAGEDALLRALLLLFGVTEAEQFSTSMIGQERGAAPSAVAARHWYSTATRTMKDWDANDPLVAVRLPGRFSVRGDWFLTLADGSQSPQLAKSAMDLLTSTRASLARMEIGVGLPTRNIYRIENQRTALYTVGPEPYKEDQQAGDEAAQFSKHHLRYGALRDLGATQDNQFRWLWRSRLQHYNRHARIWNNWLINIARGWHRRKLMKEYRELDAFEIYKFLKTSSDNSLNAKPNEKANPERVKAFFQPALARLIGDLQDATPLHFSSEEKPINGLPALFTSEKTFMSQSD